MMRCIDSIIYIGQFRVLLHFNCISVPFFPCLLSVFAIGLHDINRIASC